MSDAQKKGYGREAIDIETYTSPEEMRMDWSDAMNTIEEALEFYYDHVKDTPVDSDYDRNDVGTVQRAWQRIQQG
jgi:hypothetical protein|tara:strand:- start:214 stop:438 length:225 start_codon:yes stop_codon:yes gene_type:complete